MRRTYALDDSLLDLQLVGSVVAEIHGATIPEQWPAELVEQRRAAVERARQFDEAEDDVLQSYRDLVRSIGRSPRKFPPAAEKLIQQVKRLGDLPRINVAVDCYNLVVLDTRLAFGVHDGRQVGR